jgi:hypothetical protein
MSLRFPHRSTGGRGTPADGPDPGREFPGAPQAPESPATSPDRACCCPARPLVKIIMPATVTRPTVDLWLCGHHWRASRTALSGTGAVAYELTPSETEPATSRPGVVV